MSQSHTPSPMHTKAASTSSVAPAGAAIPAGTAPQAVLDEIRHLITDDLFEARRLAAEASIRFPGHEGIRNADRILNQGRSRVGSGGPEPSRDDEIEWLQHSPKSVRGKWVALVGADLVGTAETLAELVDFLRSKNLEEKALVHRIDE